MAWKIHLSSMTPTEAKMKLEAQRLTLLAEQDRSDVEKKHIGAGAAMMEVLLDTVPTGHEVMGWLEGRVGPRYQMGTEEMGHFGCHLSHKQKP